MPALAKFWTMPQRRRFVHRQEGMLEDVFNIVFHGQESGEKFGPKTRLENLVLKTKINYQGDTLRKMTTMSQNAFHKGHLVSLVNALNAMVGKIQPFQLDKENQILKPELQIFGRLSKRILQC